MICMIDHIVVEQAVKDGIHEGAPYTHVRAQIKKLYAKEGTDDTPRSRGRTVRGSDGKVLPPEKSVPPEYITPTREGGIPGLLPPAG